MPHATSSASTGLQAIILCGPGSSFPTFTANPDENPKALLPIANRPMVWYPLEFCYRAGITGKRSCPGPGMAPYARKRLTKLLRHHTHLPPFGREGDSIRFQPESGIDRSSAATPRSVSTKGPHPEHRHRRNSSTARGQVNHHQRFRGPSLRFDLRGWRGGAHAGMDGERPNAQRLGRQ